MQKTVSLLFSLLIVCFSIAQNGKEPVKVTDMLKIKSMAGITLSKDGTKATFIVTSIEPDGDSKLEYKYVTQIWMVNTNGSSSPKQLTSKDNSSQPAFSPDGKQLAFTRITDGKTQLLSGARTANSFYSRQMSR
jgi:dipeptidyl aminopeptidase/acylaminoacyl peptidase